MSILANKILIAVRDNPNLLALANFGRDNAVAAILNTMPAFQRYEEVRVTDQGIVAILGRELGNLFLTKLAEAAQVSEEMRRVKRWLEDPGIMLDLGNAQIRSGLADFVTAFGLPEQVTTMLSAVALVGAVSDGDVSAALYPYRNDGIVTTLELQDVKDE